MFTYSLQSVILDFSSQSYRSRNGCLEWIWIGSTYGSNAKGSPACVLRTPGVSMFLFAACLNTLMICFYSITIIHYCHFQFILLLSRTLFDLFSKFSSIFHLTSIWVKWIFIWYSHRLNPLSTLQYIQLLCQNHVQLSRWSDNYESWDYIRESMVGVHFYCWAIPNLRFFFTCTAYTNVVCQMPNDKCLTNGNITI